MHCNEATQVDIGAVLVGDTLVDTVILVNQLENQDSTWSVVGETSEVFLGSMPSALRSGDSVRILIRFAPHVRERITTPIRLVSDSSFCETFLILTGSGVGPTPDGTTILLQHTSDDILAIESSSDITHRQFYLRNDSTGPFILDTIYVDGTSAFTLDSLPSFPDTIPPLASIRLKVTFRKSSLGSENGYLISRPGHTPITDAIKISLQGLRVAFGGIYLGREGSSHVQLYPNPTHGSVRMHSERLRQVHSKVVNMLGLDVWQETHSAEWIWNGLSSDGQKILPGTYFVIISGISNEGEVVREVRPLILQ